MTKQLVKPCEFVGGACINCAATEQSDCEGWVCSPKRLWVGLTKEDKFEIAEKLGLVSVEWLNLMQVIEDKLKERNCE